MYVSLLMHISESFSIPNFDLNHEEKQREIQEIEEELARDLFKTPTYARDIYTYLQVCTMDARDMYNCLQVPMEMSGTHNMYRWWIKTHRTQNTNKLLLKFDSWLRRGGRFLRVSLTLEK